MLDWIIQLRMKTWETNDTIGNLCLPSKISLIRRPRYAAESLTEQLMRRSTLTTFSTVSVAQFQGDLREL